FPDVAGTAAEAEVDRPPADLHVVNLRHRGTAVGPEVQAEGGDPSIEFVQKAEDLIVNQFVELVKERLDAGERLPRLELPEDEVFLQPFDDHLPDLASLGVVQLHNLFGSECHDYSSGVGVLWKTRARRSRFASLNPATPSGWITFPWLANR